MTPNSRNRWLLLGLMALSAASAPAASLARPIQPFATGPGSIVGGGDHTCALSSAGTVKCWGGNGNGQLGNGSTVSAITPVDVIGINGATLVVAGDAHSCALKDDGQIDCWGGNGNGQLGSNTGPGNSTAPVAVVDVSAATTVAAGGSHTCALVAGGVKCWGSNIDGQLGNGNTTDSATVVDVVGVSGATAIAAGSSHTCALVTGGAIKCWGFNAFGQLGNGSFDDSPAAVDVVGIGGATSLVAGGHHTCAVMATGTVKCWGDNLYGQLGNDGLGNNTSMPVDVIDVADATSLVAGGAHSCALIAAGTVRCWGRNVAGQLGDGSTTVAPLAVDVIGISGANALAAGFNHTCAALPGGNLECWGSNGAGQLGNGVAADQLTPVDASGVADAVALTAGWVHSCAVVAGGTVKCWGGNASGQLGNGETTDSATAVDVIGVVGATAVIAGDEHTCALVATGQVKCWGGNNSGQLGDGSSSSSPTPVDVLDLTGVVALAAGRAHTCAVIAGGEVQCWGRNSAGQLGDGSTTGSPTPVAVADVSGATRIAAGASHTCALVAAGAAKCWGSNSSGQLGNGGTASSTTAVDVTGVTGANAISAGFGSTCVVVTDGPTKCWGGNFNGQLGNGSTQDSSTPTDVTAVVDATAIAASASHSCALVTSGAAKCWGYNGNGQLGSGNTTNSTTAVDTVGIVGATIIAAGQSHTCATVAGTVKCWGSSYHGQLGSGTLGYYTLPQAVVGSPLITTFSLIYGAGTNGALSGTSPQTVVAGEDGSAVTAVPDASFIFVRWSDGATTNPRTDINVTASIDVTAEFSTHAYTLIYRAGDNGSISGLGTQTVGTGANGLPVRAVPDSGYRFVQWSDGVTSSTRTDMNVAADLDVTAQFVVSTYVLQYFANDHGSISGENPQTVEHGADGEAVTAIPDPGYSFVDWSDGVATATRIDANVVEDVFVVALFSINTYTLTYSAGEHGSISGASPQTIAFGQDGMAVTAVPDAGYSFVQWSDASTDNPRTDTDIDGDVSVSAMFGNTPPTIAAVPDQTVLEDAGDTVLAIVVSDAESAAGDLLVTATSASPALIADPSVDAGSQPGERLLTFAPSPQQNGGPVTITLQVADPFGASSQREFTILTTAVNDAPSVAFGTVPTHPAATAGIQSVADFASVILGPEDEAATQAVDAYLITDVTDPDGVLMPDSLDIDNGGTLTYELSGVGGSAAVTARVRDNGGVAHGGDDTSAPESFVIAVVPGADLQIAKDNGRAGLRHGETTVYAVVVANDGPNAVSGASVTDILPKTLIDGSWICVQANSTATCPIPDSGVGNLDAVIDLGVDEYLRFDVMAEVDGAAGAFVVNTVDVSPPAGVTALETGNDSATDQDPILPEGIFRSGFESLSIPMLGVPGAQEAMGER